jgi:hypothetical protein
MQSFIVSIVAGVLFPLLPVFAEYGLTDTVQGETWALTEDCASIHSSVILGFDRIGSFIHQFHEEIVAVGTAFIAAFTIILGFATAALYLATRDLVKGAEATAKRQLRAYLGVRAGHVGSKDGDSTFIVMIEITNAGQTPAQEITHGISAELQIRNGPPLTFSPPERSGGKWPMVPGASHTLLRDIAIGGPSGTGSIDNGDRTIFAWGWVEYVDAFNDTHRLEFRHRNGRPMPSSRKGVKRLGTISRSHGNG